MAQDEFSIPTVITSTLKDMGYNPDTSMQTKIAEWWSWYSSTAEFYSGNEVIPGARGQRIRISRHRLTMRMARRVCKEWASLLMGEGFNISCPDDEAANTALSAWESETAFDLLGEGLVERTFGLGTGAWALWIAEDEDGTRKIRARTYDARAILPLSWDVDDCSECAFVTRVNARGKELTQLQAHVIGDDGTYHILTHIFDVKNDKEVTLDGIITDYNTGVSVPTFALIRPAIENIHADISAMGTSIFDDAIGAIQLVDNAFDSISREIDATKTKVFMSDALLDVVDEQGERITRPMSFDDTVIRAVAASGTDEMIKVFSPTIRIDALRQALDTSLEVLGDLTGFGQQYFRLTPQGGLKTATEVASDNAALMRNMRRHEIILRAAVERICTAALAMMGYDAKAVATFDDSIITDTVQERTMALSEVGAGVMPRWLYAVKYLGMSEDEARTITGEAQDAQSQPLGTML